MLTRKRLTKDQRTQIWNMCNHRCAYCGCDISFKEMQVDHVIPLGADKNMEYDTIDNMLPACRSCNHYKSTLSLEAFRKRIGNMHNVLMRDNVTYKNAIRFGVIKPVKKPIIFYIDILNNGHMLKM